MKLKKKSLLWEVGHKSGELTSYLYGTMHIKDDIAFTYFEACKEFILRCSRYAAEMNLNEAQEVGNANDYLLPNQKSLFDYLSAKKVEKIRKQILKSFSIDIIPFSRMYPLFIVNVIAESQLAKSQNQALDQEMWNYAEQHGLAMTGVESYQDQIKTLRSLSIDTQVKQLREIARQPNKIIKQTNKMVDLYFDMDIQKLYQYSKSGLGKMRHGLIHIRNRKMAKCIVEMIEKDSCFIAVGAGHLGGKNGLLARLKKSGLTIKPIALKPRPDCVTL